MTPHQFTYPKVSPVAPATATHLAGSPPPASSPSR